MRFTESDTTVNKKWIIMNAWFFCDEEAASKLKLKKFYAWRSEIEMKG